MLVRPAIPADCEALCQLRNFYISHSFASPTIIPATLEQTAGWLTRLTQGGAYRLLVGVENDRVVGLASSFPYDASTPAYGNTVMSGICLAPECQGRGVGTLIYTALLDELIASDFNSVVATINLPNEPSVALHRKLGFEDVGILKKIVTKNERIHDMLIVQRMF